MSDMRMNLLRPGGSRSHNGRRSILAVTCGTVLASETFGSLTTTRSYPEIP